MQMAWNELVDEQNSTTSLGLVIDLYSVQFINPLFSILDLPLTSSGNEQFQIAKEKKIITL